MNVLKLLARILKHCNKLGQHAKRFIEVKYSYWPTLVTHLNFVLLLHCSVVDESRIAFLYLDERDVLMDGCFDKRVSFVMLLHQHQQAGKWHSKHLCKLLRVKSLLLCLEHAWLFAFKIVQFLDLLFVLHSLLEQLPLLNLSLHVLLRKVLPLILDLIVNQPVSLF